MVPGTAQNWIAVNGSSTIKLNKTMTTLHLRKSVTVRLRGEVRRPAALRFPNGERFSAASTRQRLSTTTPAGVITRFQPHNRQHGHRRRGAQKNTTGSNNTANGLVLF